MVVHVPQNLFGRFIGPTEDPTPSWHVFFPRNLALADCNPSTTEPEPEGREVADDTLVEASVFTNFTGQDGECQPGAIDLLQCGSALGAGSVLFEHDTIATCSTDGAPGEGVVPVVRAYRPHDSYHPGRCAAAARVANRILLCNDLTLRHRSKYMFTHTERFSKTISGLPWRACNGERDLRAFVQDLYELLIEATHAKGGHSFGRLRPFLRREEGTVLDCIRDLRNRWASHDPGVGPANARSANEDKLREWLSWLGVAGSPTSQEECCIMRDRLLDRVEQMLEILVSRVVPKC